MNAERLHALANKIQEELEITSPVENLQAITTALQQAGSSQSTATQQRVADAVTNFRDSMEQSTIPGWSPGWLQLLEAVSKVSKGKDEAS